ncbi:hypothetical protein RclHR1_16140002 [Rhizophagus clarus]|uniref:Uncharacterized protein n=1 Tax=Rhizophagus clarus TaxID=94130 RepID=A0A2Z6R9P7_9GLOM|nr:hypothetical protein RclHR1_16140002 [Rhizophagus clarus]
MQPDVKEFGLHSVGYIEKEEIGWDIGKSNEEVHDIIVDAHLNLDDDLIETMEEEYVDSNMGVFDENSENSMKEEYIDIQDVDEMVENENDIDWDSM